MVLEYSMYPQLVSSMLTDWEQIGSDSNYFNFYSLVSLQRLADALGDGFYAENHTVANDISVPMYTSAYGTTAKTIISGKSIPVLRNTNLGDMAVFFGAYFASSVGASYSERAVAANIIDVSTDTLVATAYMHVANGTVSDCRIWEIVNASDKVKMICSYEKNYALGGLIFYNGNIIYNCTTPNYAGNNGKMPIGLVASDKSFHTAEYWPTILNKNVISLVPFRANTLPNESWKGVYVATQLTNRRIECNVTNGGKMFFFPALYNAGGENAGTVLVISDEVQEVTQ